MPSLTRRELDAASCQVPGCTHDGHGPLYLHAVCHPSAGTRARYDDGLLYIDCRKCKAEVAVVAVAAGSEPAIFAR